MQNQPNLWTKKLTRTPLQLAGMQVLRPDWEESFRLVSTALDTMPVRIGWIYANCVNMLRRNQDYKQSLQAFELLWNDGAGVEIAARILGAPVATNLCGTDWIPALLDQMNNEQPGMRVFLLGTRPEYIGQACDQFVQRWPGLVLAGSHHGYFNDDATVLKAIQEAQPALLIVGLGVPRQEAFLAAYWPNLTQSGVRLAVAGGAIMDHFAGAVTRAPTWLQRLRLEWLYRLLTEPRRLWRRYLIGNTIFFWDLLKEWRQRHARKSD